MNRFDPCPASSTLATPYGVSVFLYVLGLRQRWPISSHTWSNHRVEGFKSRTQALAYFPSSATRPSSPSAM